MSRTPTNSALWSLALPDSSVRSFPRSFARAWALTAWTRAELDLTDGPRVARAVQDVRPWAIVNCAGYNQVDLAEEQHITALEANAFAVRTLARAAE